MNYLKLIERLLPVLRLTGERILTIRQAGVTGSLKDDGTPVTEADAVAEEMILDALRRMDNRIPVVSEENFASHDLKDMDLFFLVDALDGTKEFLKTDGSGAYTVNVALVENRRPVLGMVYAPALDRMFYGDSVNGAYEESPLGRNALSVRPVPDSGPVAVASASHRDPQTDQWLKHHRVTKTVSIGSSLKFCLVAAGEADVYPRYGPTMEWDTAAGDAILRAAGGKVTTPDGREFLYGKEHYRNGAFIASGQFDT